MNIDVAVIMTGFMVAMSWGISDYFAAKSVRMLSPVVAGAAANIVCFLGFLPVYVVAHSSGKMAVSGALLAAGGGVALALGALAFFAALQAGPVSAVSPISSTYPLVMTMLAVIGFRTHLSFSQWMAVVLIIAGVMTASGVLGLKQPGKAALRGPVFAMLTALGWGIGYVLLAQAIVRNGWILATMIEELSVFAVFVTVLALRQKVRGGPVTVPRPTVWRALLDKHAIVAGLTQLVGVVALNLGIADASASGAVALTTVSSCYPILTIILAFWRFGEERQLLPVAGAVLGVVGCVLLSLD